MEVPNNSHSPTTENLILLGLIKMFMQLYTGYFSSDHSLCAGFSLPMCQERRDDDDDDDDDDESHCISVLAF